MTMKSSSPALSRWRSWDRTMDTVVTSRAPQVRLSERQLGWRLPCPRRERGPSVSRTRFIRRPRRRHEDATRGPPPREACPLPGPTCVGRTRCGCSTFRSADRPCSTTFRTRRLAQPSCSVRARGSLNLAPRGSSTCSPPATVLRPHLQQRASEDAAQPAAGADRPHP